MHPPTLAEIWLQEHEAELLGQTAGEAEAAVRAAGLFALLWEPIADYDIGQPVPQPAPATRIEEEAIARRAVAAIRAEAPAGVRVDASLLGL